MDYESSVLEFDEFIERKVKEAFEKYLDEPVERLDLYEGGDGSIVLEINGNGLQITVGQLLMLADKASPIIWDRQMQEEDNNRRAHDEWMN